MTGNVRPARAGLNKVTKPSSPTAAGRRQSRQLLTAAAVLAEQQRRQQQHQHQHLATAAATLDDPHALLHQHHQEQQQHQQPQQLQHHHHQQQQQQQAHAHPHQHHGQHHHQHMVDLHIPDANVKPDHDTLHDDHTAPSKAVEIPDTVVQDMDLSADASLLAAGPSLLDASGPVPSSGYSSPPQVGLAQPHSHAHGLGHHHAHTHSLSHGHNNGHGQDDDDAEQHGHNHDHDHTRAHGHGHHHDPEHDPDHAHAHDHERNPSAAPAHHHGLEFMSQLRLTEDMASTSGYSGFVTESALAKRLAREPGQRLAQQRRPEQSLNLARRSNVEALFAHIAGEEVLQPCKNCRKGHGPWTVCVIVDGQMCGSCANCWFNASGARCSFHETRNLQGHPLSQQAQQHHVHPLQTAAGGPTSQDPYAVPSPLALAPPPGSAPGGGGGGGGGISFGPGLSMTDAAVRYTVERCMSDVRAADRKARQLIKVEIAAKQLALEILEYEEMAAAGQGDHHHDADGTGQSAQDHAVGDVGSS
ncbi:hypothetical protein RB601_000218 [Gaeumannomyces tritici]